MPPADVVLALHDVRKDYHGLRPLRLQRLDVRQGESVALLGFDRVAAEIFSNLVIGAALPDAGDVQTFGTPTRSIADADEWLAGMHRFGILSERIVLLESSSVEQNLALPFSLEIDQIPPDVRARVRGLADEVGLATRWLTEPAGTLTADALQRTRLAKALALGPRVLLAEHPNGWDAGTSGWSACCLGRSALGPRCRRRRCPASRRTWRPSPRDATWRWSS